MHPLESYQTILFDCDGVILDSNPMKSEAFCQALEGEDPGLVEEFLTYHKTHGGVSRHVKFTHFYEHMKKEKSYETSTQEALERFAQRSREGLMACPEIPGVREFLESLQGKIPCFVISGGDRDEIKESLNRRELSPFFREILGGHATKKENIRYLEKQGWLQRPCIYFGDACSDFEASREFDLDFIFVAGHSEWKEGRNVCEQQGHRVIEDFQDFKKW